MKVMTSELEALLRMGEAKINELREEKRQLKQENTDLRRELTRLQSKYEMNAVND